LHIFVNSDLHASKKPKDKKKDDSNVSVTECEGVTHVRWGKSTTVVRPHYGVNKLTNSSISFITK
jgi:hypothetical protein